MAETLAKRVGRHVAKFRETRGLRQVDLAAECGLPQETISRIENGRYDGLGMNTFERICRALSVSAKEFFETLPGE